MISIGTITLPLLVLIIAMCEAGVTELNVAINPKPVFQNRTNMTSAPTSAPMRLSASEQSQANEHMKKTLALLNSMTPKQRAHALSMMSTSDSALDRYVCKMISESDGILVRHMNEKLSLIQTIPEDQRGQILDAMLKSNNSADRNLAEVIMKNNEQGGDKNGQRLQALKELGPHDRAELLKRMSNSSSAVDQELAKKVLSSGKDSNNNNIPTSPNSTVNLPLAVSPAISKNAADASSPQSLKSGKNISTMAPSPPSRSTVNLSSMAISQTPSPTSIAVSETPHPAANTSAMAVSETPHPAANTSAMAVSETPHPAANTSAMAVSETPRPTAILSSMAVSETPRPAVNLSTIAPSKIPAFNTSAVDLSATSSNSSSMAPSVAARPAMNLSSIPAFETSRPTANISSIVPAETLRSAVDSVLLPLNHSVPSDAVGNTTSSIMNQSISETPMPIKNVSALMVSTKKPDFRNIAMLWNASNSTDDLFNSKLDNSGNASMQNNTSVKASALETATTNKSLDNMTSPMDFNGNKTLAKSPYVDDEIIFGVPVPSWLSPKNGTSTNAASVVDSPDNSTITNAQPWTEFNKLPEQNLTDSVNPGTDAMLTLENSKLTMHHFDEQSPSQSESIATGETVTSTRENTSDAESPLTIESAAPSNSSSENGSLEDTPTGSVSKQTVLIQTSPEQSSWFNAIAGYLPSITSYHHSLYADDDTQPILEHLGEAPIPSRSETLSTEHLGEAPIPSQFDQLPDATVVEQDQADADNDMAASDDNDTLFNDNSDRD